MLVYVCLYVCIHVYYSHFFSFFACIDVNMDIVPSAAEKSAANLNAAEKEALLAKYDASVLRICSKCYTSFAHVLKDVKNDFKRAQITSQRGCIIIDGFRAILKNHNAQVYILTHAYLWKLYSYVYTCMQMSMKTYTHLSLS